MDNPSALVYQSNMSLYRSASHLRVCLVLAACAALPAFAGWVPVRGAEASSEQGLTSQMLRSIEAGVPMTPRMRAARNALADHDIRSLIVNQKKVLSTDGLFNHEIDKPGSITNQKSSGRCWLFAGLNILRPKVMNKYNMKDFTLSQAYEQFYQKLEAANRSLELAIALRSEPLHSRRMDTLLKDVISDGGNWNYVQALIEKYGAVPESVMPDDHAASHTREMNALLAARLRKGIVQIRSAAHAGQSVAQLREMKMHVLQDVYKILVICLGPPPSHFAWRYETAKGKVSPLKHYTPRSFYKTFLGNDLNDYVRFVNYPGKPMHARLQWSWERNMADEPDLWAVNVSMKELRSMALESVMANQPVWFGADSGADGARKLGLWFDGITDAKDLFGIDFDMSKKDALAYDEGGPTHAMVFTGVDVENGEPVQWKVENSWGKKYGKKGWFSIGKRWFDKHVYEIVINKRFVPARLLKLSHQKPVVLPPWDPFADWSSAQ